MNLINVLQSLVCERENIRALGVRHIVQDKSTVVNLAMDGILCIFAFKRTLSTHSTYKLSS